MPAIPVRCDALPHIRTAHARTNGRDGPDPDEAGTQAESGNAKEKKKERRRRRKKKAPTHPAEEKHRSLQAGGGVARSL